MNSILTIPLQMRIKKEKSTFDSFITMNKQPIDELLKGFFKYFHEFDFKNLEMNIKEGIVTKRLKRGKPISIIDPCDSQNNVARSFHSNNYLRFEFEIQRAVELLSGGGGSSDFESNNNDHTADTTSSGNSILYDSMKSAEENNIDYFKKSSTSSDVGFDFVSDHIAAIEDEAKNQLCVSPNGDWEHKWNIQLPKFKM
jgi:hypothetical protein